MHNKIYQDFGSVLKIALTYVGTVIGAGFASGQEILRFFTVYGVLSYIGILIATVLFIVSGIKVMELGNRYKAESFADIIDNAMNNKMTFVLNIFLIIALFITVAAMLAGTFALFEEHLGISGIVGIILISALCIITILCGISGMYYINVLIVPLLITFMLIIFIKSLVYKSASGLYLWNSYNSNFLNLIVTSVLYVSMNLLMSIGVLGAIGRNTENKSIIVKGGIFGGLILGGLIFISNYSIYKQLPYVFNYEIPVIYIVTVIGADLKLFYSFVVFGEIFSTLVAGVFSFVELFNKYKIKPIITCIIILFSGYIFSKIGFSDIVSYVYPIIGILGFIFIVLIFTPELKKIFNKIMKLRFKRRKNDTV